MISRLGSYNFVTKGIFFTACIAAQTSVLVGSVLMSVQAPHITQILVVYTICLSICVQTFIVQVVCAAFYSYLPKGLQPYELQVLTDDLITLQNLRQANTKYVDSQSGASLRELKENV